MTTYVLFLVDGTREGGENDVILIVV